VDGIPDLIVFGGSVRITRRRRAFPQQAAARRVQQDGLDLGAAQVDAQAVGRVCIGLFVEFIAVSLCLLSSDSVNSLILHQA
jgi:hypothetical protein